METNASNSTLAASGDITQLNVRGMSVLSIQVVGSMSAVLSVEATIDGKNWFALNVVSKDFLAPQSTIFAAGVFFANVSGLAEARVRCSAYTSGTPTIALMSNSEGVSIPSGAQSLLTPSAVALSQTVSSSISSSTTIAIIAGARIIRVYVADKDVYLKWGSIAVTSSNFDEIIPANQIVDLYVPIEVATGLLFTTMRVIERAATATIVVIQK